VGFEICFVECLWVRRLLVKRDQFHSITSLSLNVR
jgi:hypothetical protein